jgi:Zn-dependent peptidase ImmA (M78 family)
MVAVPINKEVLVWARKQRGLSAEDAAKRLNMPVGDLLELEGGARPPTLGVLERIASGYRLPLVTLLMPAPLPEADRAAFQDFRAFEGHPAGKLAPETVLAIEEAYTDLELMGDLKEAAPQLFGVPLVPPYTLSDDPVSVAASERERLAVTTAAQFAWSNDREAFLRWRELAEAQGVFVYQMKLGGDDTRGFAMWDDREIPVAVIDATESGYPAKIFTLWHEYAHLLLRTGGISNQNRKNSVERFCNVFAAHFLMPMSEFRQEASLVAPRSRAWKDSDVTRLANRFRVSKSAVAIHLEAARLVPDGFYGRMRALWQSRPLPSSKGRATHPEKIANRLGGRHISLVMDALRQGVLNKIDAREYLDVRPDHFEAVEAEVRQRRINYGRPG